LQKVEADRATPDHVDITFSDGQVMHLSLGPIHAMMSQTAPADRAKRLGELLADLIASQRRQPLSPADRTRILPVLRRVDDTPALAKIVFAPFSKTVHVLFEVANIQGGADAAPYLTGDMLAELELTTDQLMPQAIQNLNTLARGHVKVTRISGSPFSRVDMNAHHESSLMLHAPFWNSMAKQSQGVLAAALARDLVVLAPDRISSIDAFPKIRKTQIETAPMSLSQKLWRWTGDGWKQVAT
jgi:hypothetical protein